MNTKKPLSILLTLALVLGLLPWAAMPARAADVTEIEITSWAALKSNSSAAEVTTTNGVTTVKLKACIKLTAKLEIASDALNEQPYVLDLNGYGIRYAGTDGSVICPEWRCSSLTLKDSNPSRDTYYITLTDGRGTAVSDGAPSGTEGTDYLTVDGGYITGGSASTGGGVYITTPFTMEGGTICGNKAKSVGGVGAAAFTMSGGAISYNSATSETGGVSISNKGTALMTGGTIAHNSGPYTDVYNYRGTFVMTGGTIGYEGQDGDSVNNYGHFYRKSGSIHGNVDYSAAQTISTVTASAAANGTVAVSSDPAWTDKTTNYYAEGDTVTLTVTPDEGYQLDTLTVKDASSNNVEVGGTGNTRTFTMPGSNVTVSATFAALPVAQVNETPYTSVQDAINAASSDYENSPGTVTLLANVTVDEPLTIESGRYVTLDLAGFTIDRGLADKDAARNGNVITVKGSLTLEDSSATNAEKTNGTGKLTGGNNSGDGGGGVYVWRGTFTMTGGTISGNTADDGGGVCVREIGATFNMSGGTITGNTANDDGGGVFVYDAVFNMSGGTITGNTANDGGGVQLENSSSTFNMSGGAEISGNTANNGGGVYVGGMFTMSGGTITGNTAAGNGGGVYAFLGVSVRASGGATVTGNVKGGTITNGELSGGTADNVYLTCGNEYTGGPVAIRIADKLTGKLGVTLADNYTGAFTSELAGKGTAANFTSDNGSYLVKLNDANEAELLASSVDGGTVTAPKGATLVCATYKNGQMAAVQTVTLDANCVGASAATLLGKASLPTGCKLFLLAKGTFAPLCAAWDSAGSPG